MYYSHRQTPPPPHQKKIYGWSAQKNPQMFTEETETSILEEEGVEKRERNKLGDTLKGHW